MRAIEWRSVLLTPSLGTVATNIPNESKHAVSTHIRAGAVQDVLVLS